VPDFCRIISTQGEFRAYIDGSYVRPIPDVRLLRNIREAIVRLLLLCWEFSRLLSASKNPPRQSKTVLGASIEMAIATEVVQCRHAHWTTDRSG
jgi:hypothetical protein